MLQGEEFLFFTGKKKVSERFVKCAPCNFPHVLDFLWGCLNILQHKSDSSKSPGCSVDASSHMVGMSTEACFTNAEGIYTTGCLENN